VGRGAAKRAEAHRRYRPLIIRPFTKGGEVWCLRALAQQDGVEAKRPAGRSI